VPMMLNVQSDFPANPGRPIGRSLPAVSEAGFAPFAHKASKDAY